MPLLCDMDNIRLFRVKYCLCFVSDDDSVATREDAECEGWIAGLNFDDVYAGIKGEEGTKIGNHVVSLVLIDYIEEVSDGDQKFVLFTPFAAQVLREIEERDGE